MATTEYFPSHAPYNKNSDHYLWFSILPMKLYYSGPFADSDVNNVGVSASRDTSEPRFMFLAPEEFQDTITHNWDPMENIMSRLQEKYANAKRELRSATTQYKVDTPLLYQDSNRREISFTVYLGVYDDYENDVMYPINKLRELSSPRLSSTESIQTKVGNPHVFEVNTMTGAGKLISLINMRNCALTSVQPSFQGPYIRGYPSKCELTLNFKDMKPISKETFTNIESRVTVG